MHAKAKVLVRLLRHESPTLHAEIFAYALVGSAGHKADLLVEGLGGTHPDQDDTQEDDAEVGGGGCQGAEAHNHDLLDEGSARLAQGVAHDINGSLALELQQHKHKMSAHSDQLLGQPIVPAIDKVSLPERGIRSTRAGPFSFPGWHARGERLSTA